MDISITKDEPMHIVKALEIMFPKADLKPAEAILMDLSITGNLSVSKKIGTETITVNLNVK